MSLLCGSCSETAGQGVQSQADSMKAQGNQFFQLGCYTQVGDSLGAAS